jgi:Ser/Thr protein kinase RdoA (MazF antagonist)
MGHYHEVAREEPLVGGMHGTHTVVRVGDTIRRPPTESSGAVRALLMHLENVGFDGAPRYLGSDAEGRDVLSYIDGQVPLPPYPAWSMTDAALVDLAHLLRRFHEATASLDLAGISGWATDWADPIAAGVVCHNDLFPENVVFRDGRVIALIDFDMAAPGRPLWDVAIAAQEWAPLSAPEARRDHPRHLDAVARLGRFARAYGVEPDCASQLVDLVFAERQQALAHIQSQIADGNQTWVDHWRESRGEERTKADDAWLEQHRDALVNAIGGTRRRRP